MTAKDTDELMHLLQDTKTTAQLQTYTNTLAEQTILQTFPEYLNSKMIERNISPAELIAAAQIQRNYGYQILNGTRKPSRDKILALCLALGLDLPETQRALTLAQFGQLYPKNQRDSIFIFSINKQLSVLQVNELLDEMKEELLFN